MGAKFGNIQVLNTSVEELGALLPKAVVGQWSERFVTALSENYAMGTVEREGQKLSRKVAGPVLTVGLFDDDLLGLTVFQDGKRLTEHVLNPYDGINKAGNPAVFCAALGLPAEDEKRLRAVWKKGNATEQLDLTQKLLAAPLWCDENWQPDTSVTRDAEAVDCWLNERPEPPKLKNKTKAELIQELRNHQISFEAEHSFGAKSGVFQFTLVNDEGEYYPEEEHERFYRLDSDGMLHDVGACSPVVKREDRTGSPRGLNPEERVIVRLKGRIYTEECLPQKMKFHFRCRGTNGAICGEQALEWNSRFVGDAPSGELWMEEPTKDGKRLLHLDENLNILAQSTDFPGYSFNLARNPAGDILLATIFNEGIWLLDADTLAVKQELRSKAQVYGPIVDGHGRFWVGSGDSTIEAYDENLQPISRHRLKGGLLVDGRWLDEKGNLCVLTSNMPKGNHVRVYRIT